MTARRGQVVIFSMLFLLVFLLLLSDFSQVQVPLDSTQSHKSLGAVTWKAGEQFPREDGLTVYPLSVPTDGANVQGGPESTHWYAGTRYSGSDGEANFVETEITTPPTTPRSSQYYYLLLSVWNSQGGYDQIGISAYHGEWGLAYSSSNGSCADPDYYFDAFALGLNISTTYIFSMGILTNSSNSTANIVTFGLVSPSYPGDLLYFNYVSVPHVTSFLIQKAYCAADKTNDYQNYEEVYTGGVPNFNFSFAFNEWCRAGSNNCNSVNFASWVPWKSKSAGYVAPKKVTVVVDVSEVTINN